MGRATGKRHDPIDCFVEQSCHFQLQLAQEVGPERSKRLLLQLVLMVLLKSRSTLPQTLDLHPAYPQFLSDRHLPPDGSTPWIDQILQVFQAYAFSLHEQETDKITPAILGHLLEQFLGERDRKSNGVFYTPPTVVAEMVQGGLSYYLTTPATPLELVEPLVQGQSLELPESIALDLDQRLATLKVCDPALGAGAFAVELVRAIATLRQTLTGKPIAGLMRHALTHSIYGMDVDPLAIATTRVRLALLAVAEAEWDLTPCLPQALEQHLVYGNALLECHPHQPFDLLITNPPYVQIKQIPWADRKRYEQLFFSASGRFNLFYLFLEQSSYLTRSGGICALLVPDRLLLNTQCQNLRRWLLQQQTLLEISTFATPTEIAVNQVAILYRNAIPDHPWVTLKTSLGEQRQRQQIPCHYFLQSPYQQFDCNYQPLTLSILEKIRGGSIQLGAIATIKDGIIQGKVADQLFLTAPRNQNSKKLVFGRDIERYRITFNQCWVNYEPDRMMQLERDRRGAGVRPGLWLRHPNVFEHPKILTRQTADQIIAAFDSEPYYYTNTLHGITLTHPQYDPLYVLAVLNSRLMTWYYRTTSAEQGKVFAQIKIAVLRQLPIPVSDRPTQHLFAQLAQQLMDTAPDLTALDRFLNLQRESDRRLYELYQLTAEEIALVEARP